MSVRIRLAKTGKKHQISYRVIAQDSRTKRDGRFLEILGFYNPKLGSPQNLNIKKDRYDWWVSRGAQPTEGVARLLKLPKAEGLTANAESDSANAKSESDPQRQRRSGGVKR